MEAWVIACIVFVFAGISIIKIFLSREFPAGGRVKYLLLCISPSGFVDIFQYLVELTGNIYSTRRR
jgi:hypothetical protein